MFKFPNRYYGENGTVGPMEGRRFQEIIEEAFYLSAASNPEDFLPVTRWLGVSKLKKRLVKLEKEIDELLQGMVDERRTGRQTKMIEEEKKTILDVMLSLQETEAEHFTDQIIKGMIMVLVDSISETEFREKKNCYDFSLLIPLFRFSLQEERIHQLARWNGQ